MKSVIDYIAEACDNKIVFKKADVDLFKTGLLDSLAFINLLVTLEEEFGIEIPSEEVNREQFSTPRKICEYINAKIRARK